MRATQQVVPPARLEMNGAAQLEKMYSELRPRFLSLAYSILRNREDAEDAVQDAFASAYRTLPSFEGRSALATWLTRIVMNAALMLVRKRKSSRLVPCPEDRAETSTPWIERVQCTNPDPEAICAESETFRMVENLLRSASPGITAAFKLNLYDDVSAEEGAQHLGISAGTFKSRVFRARRHLRTRGRYALIAPIRRSVTAGRHGGSGQLSLGQVAA
jgi:RNA polymerase sigma-70 factor (ECF subfamily)